MGNRRLELYPAEYAVLAHLVENARRTVSQEENANRVLHSPRDSAAVRHQIYAARRQLEAAGCEDPIVTSEGHGYRIAGTPSPIGAQREAGNA